MTALFITGTDTGVGKTVITAGLAAQALALGRTVCVYKPLQTGSLCLNVPEDPTEVQRLLGLESSPDGPFATFCSHNFHPPVAPYVADTGRIIHLADLETDFRRLQSRYDVVLVEGAGGVRVPIAPGLDTTDLIRALDIPTLVVARPNLGTINHTLLTLEALQNRDIEVTGVVVSGYRYEEGDLAIQTLPDVFTEFLPVPLLALAPPLDMAPGALSPNGEQVGQFQWASALFLEVEEMEGRVSEKLPV